MSFILVDHTDRASHVRERLSNETRIALDCEAAGFHRYSDRLCLVQLSTREETYLFDALAIDASESLRPVLENPDVQVVMHGADYDVRLLDRDLGIRPTQLLDTQIAAALLGERSLGLAALMERFLGIELSKKHQRADWAVRPLPAEMLEYAASDTRNLLELSDQLRERLEDAGRWSWAREEFRLLGDVRWQEEAEEDPVVRVRGSRDLEPRELERLREGLVWRDGIARAQDRAPFRVVGDKALIDVAVAPPATLEDLAAVSGMNGRLARAEGRTLLARLERVEALADGQLQRRPRPPSNGRGRPPPEVDDVARRLKDIRNRRAEELGVDRGTLLPNAVIMEIAWESPGSEAELAAIEGIKRWQGEQLGPRLLEALAG